jgi:molybdopterin/thiamine biosynthesis adenylyltransferase
MSDLSEESRDEIQRLRAEMSPETAETLREIAEGLRSESAPSNNVINNADDLANEVVNSLELTPEASNIILDVLNQVVDEGSVNTAPMWQVVNPVLNPPVVTINGNGAVTGVTLTSDSAGVVYTNQVVYQQNPVWNPAAITEFMSTDDTMDDDDEEDEIEEVPVKEGIDLADVAIQRSRFKGAPWFKGLYEKDVMVLGQGGIGSWLTLFLARIGCKLAVHDMDTFEAHNMSGQFVTHKHIGKSKTQAIADLVSEFAVGASIEQFGAYDESSYTNDIVLCGFDNMAARKLAFEKWSAYVATLTDEQKKECIFIDGRLLPTIIQVFCIKGNDAKAIAEYPNYIYTDAEIAQEDCTFKQTSHCAAIIAGMMTNFLTNFVVKSAVYKVPFYHEYLLPMNSSSNNPE